MFSQIRATHTVGVVRTVRSGAIACLILALLLTNSAAAFANSRPAGVEQTGRQGSAGEEVETLEDAQKAVIQIEAVGTFVDPSEGMQQNVPGYGSGFIIDPSGIAVTNNHVVTGGALFKVYVEGKDKPVNARVLGVSECSDLAVIDLQGDGYAYLNWYEQTPKVGLDVYALGFPLGDPEFTMTRGIIAKAKADGETNWASVDHVVQHDAVINPGNSGGPLVTKDGQVVGVNYAGDDENNQYFAIAGDIAIPIVEQLINGINVDSLGVNGEAFITDDGLTGIWVYSVQSGSPADGVGLLPGDVILEVEGLTVGADGLMSDYCDILSSHNPAEDVLSITVYRPDTDETLQGQLNGRSLEVAVSISGEESATDDSSSSESDDEIIYTPISDTSGAINLEAPEEWSDIVERPWEVGGDEVGVQLIAALDTEKFFDSWDEPGVIFSFSDVLQDEFEAADLLDTLDYSDDCEYIGRTEMPEDGFYRGAYDEYEQCGGGDTQALIAVLTPETGDYILGIELYAATDSDVEAVDHILETFYVETGAAPDDGSVADDIFEMVDTSGLEYEYSLLNEPSFSALTPADWTDVVAEDWTTDDDEVLGTRLTIAADVEAFNDSWSVPGIQVRTATGLEEELDIDDLLDTADMSDTCTYEERIDTSHTIYGVTYSGKYDLYTECDGEENAYASLIALSDTGDHLFWIDFVAVDDADAEAFDVLLQSFFLASAAQANESTINPDEFSTISDDSGLISISVPNTWQDLDSGDWESDGDPIGVYLTASPNLEDFSGGWETPGMWVGVTDAGDLTADDVLDNFDFAESCEYDTRYDYEDERFVGKYDFWTKCNEIDGSLFAVFAFQPVDDDQTGVVMYTYMPGEDDIAALEPMLLTLTVNGDGAVSAEEDLGSVEEGGSSNLPLATVLVETLNVRAGPGTNYERITSASKDTVLGVIGQVDDCAWLLVTDADDNEGWISGGARYVTLDGDCADIPDASDQAPVAPSASASGQSAGGNARQGCIMFKNQVGSELVITFTRRGDNWNTTFSVPKGQSGEKCLDAGRYSITINTPSGLELNDDLDIAAGSYLNYDINPPN